MADGRLVVVPDSVDKVLLAVVCSSEVDAKIVDVSVAVDEITTVGVSLLAVTQDFVGVSVVNVSLLVLGYSTVDVSVVTDDDSVVSMLLPVYEASVVLVSGIGVGISVVDIDLVDGADTENKFVFRGEATGVLLEWLVSVDVPVEICVSVDSMVDGRFVVVPDSVDDVLLAVVCSFVVDAKIFVVSVADDEITTVGSSLLTVTLNFVGVSVVNVSLVVLGYSTVDGLLVTDDNSVVRLLLTVDEASVVLVSGVGVGLSVVDVDLVASVDVPAEV